MYFAGLYACKSQAMTHAASKYPQLPSPSPASKCDKECEVVERNDDETVKPFTYRELAHLVTRAWASGSNWTRIKMCNGFFVTFPECMLRSSRLHFTTTMAIIAMASSPLPLYSQLSNSFTAPILWFVTKNEEWCCAMTAVSKVVDGSYRLDVLRALH